MASKHLPLILLTLLAFALRVYGLGQHSLWYDELLELAIAQGPLAHLWPELTRHSAMPLDYLLLYGWVQLGQHEAWVRFPAVVFGTLTVPLTYALAYRMFNQRVGYLAAGLMTVSLFAIRYSQEARPYALLMFWTVVATLGLWQVYRTEQPRYWLLTALGLVGAMLSHYFTLFLLAPFGLFVGYQHLLRGRWSHLSYFAATALAVMLTVIIAGNAWTVFTVGWGFSRVAHQPELLTVPADDKPNRGTGPPLSLDFFRERVLAPLSTPHPIGMVVYQTFFILAVASMLWTSRREQSARWLLLGWLVMPVLLVYVFLVYRGTFYAIRYILYTLPAYVMLVAAGIDRLTHGMTFKLARYGFLLVMVVPLVQSEAVEWRAYTHGPSYEEWRAVNHILQAHATPDDLIVAPRAERVMRWYDPPARTMVGTSEYQRLSPALDIHKRRWFVLSSYSYRHDGELRQWLRQQQAVSLAIDRRVRLYYHRDGATRAEMLAEVQHFNLPALALTHASLGDQFRAIGAYDTSQTFYHTAVQLAATAAEQHLYEAKLVERNAP